MYCTFLKDEGDRWRPALDWMKNGISLKDGGARLRPALDWMMHCTQRRPLAASPRLERQGRPLAACPRPDDALRLYERRGWRMRPALAEWCTEPIYRRRRPLAASPRPSDALHISPSAVGAPACGQPSTKWCTTPIWRTEASACGQPSTD